MIFFLLHGWGRGAVLLVCALLTAGCAEDVTAVLGTDRAFSLYGVLSPQLDTQWVRVFPVEGRLTPAAGAALDARFTSTDLATGAVRVWNDSLFREADGHYAHAFWSPFRAGYGRAYRLDVVRSDGAAVRVETAVPPATDVVPQAPRLTPGSVVLPVRVEGGAPRLLKVEVGYTVDFRLLGPGTRPDEHYVIDYNGRAVAEAGGWTLPIDLSGDFKAVRDTLVRRAKAPLDAGFGLMLLGVTVRFLVASDDWAPPGGRFDAEVLIQPGVMSNVQGGFGFVGAGYRQQLNWLPPAEAVRAAGFRPRDDASPFLVSFFALPSPRL